MHCTISSHPAKTQKLHRDPNKNGSLCRFFPIVPKSFRIALRRATTPPRTAYAVGSPPPAVCRQRTAVPVIQPRSCNRCRIDPVQIHTGNHRRFAVCQRVQRSDRLFLKALLSPPVPILCRHTAECYGNTAQSLCGIALLRQCFLIIRPQLHHSVLCRKNWPLLRHGCGHPFAGGAAYSLPAVQWHLHSL